MPFFEAIGISVSTILSNTFFNNSRSPHLMSLCVIYYFNEDEEVSSFKSSPLFRRGFAFYNSGGNHILIVVPPLKMLSRKKDRPGAGSDVLAACSSAMIDTNLVNVSPHWATGSLDICSNNILQMGLPTSSRTSGHHVELFFGALSLQYM